MIKLLSIFLMISNPVWSISLELARGQGLVGEKSDGHIAAVSKGASVEVKKLIAEVNRKRDAKYKEIAQSNKSDVAAVKIATHKKIVAKLKAGQYYQNASGSWVRK